MRVVPMLSTPISAEHARDALSQAMPGIDRDSASLLLALIWVETGRGKLINNNAGNLSAGSSYPGAVWRPPWFDRTDTPHLADLHARMLAGTAPSAFRAYDSAPEGVADFVAVLKSRFPSVLAAARDGSPADFVRALHDSGYSPDYTLAHVPTFTSLRAEFMPLLTHLPGSAGAGAGAGIGGALAFALAGIVLAHLQHKRKRRRTWRQMS